MNVDFQRKVDRYVGAVICRLLSLFHSKHRKVSNKAKADRVLVILLSEMGSLVLAHSMVTRLKNKFPNASLYFLLFEENRQIVEILDYVSPANILTISNDSMFRFTKNSLHVLRKFRQIGFDIVIDCEKFARISSIFSRLSGAPIRVGFHPYNQEGLYRGNFINRPVLYNPYHHIARQFITMVDAIDSDSKPTSKYPVTTDPLAAPVVKFEQEEINRMQKRLDMDFPGISTKQLILINPTGGILPIRAWPIDHYCQLAAEFLTRGYAVAVIGLESDKELARAIQSYCNDSDCIDLTGYTRSIRELMILYHLASLLVTNDGGPAHFASMTPMPSIIFFGPETPYLYGPLGDKAVSLYVPLACSPCTTAYNHEASPCDGDNLCLKSILPEEVLANALQLLEKQNNTRAATVNN